MYTKTFKIYGFDGHRQKVSFEPSKTYDFSEDGKNRVLRLFCSDKTGTNDFVLLEITCDTENACDNEFSGQLSDGIFENARVGRWETTDAPFED